MERDADQPPERFLGRHHGREHDPAEQSEVDLEQDTIPLEDVAGEPAESPAVDDV